MKYLATETLVISSDEEADNDDEILDYLDERINEVIDELSDRFGVTVARQ